MTSLISDSELEIRKFKMFADKVDTEAKVIDLCKKYLKHKGIDVDQMTTDWANKKLEQPKIEKHYIGPGNNIYKTIKIDRRDLLQGYPPEIIADAKIKVAQHLLRDLIDEGYLKFDTNENFYEDRTEIVARIHVFKRD